MAALNVIEFLLTVHPFCCTAPVQPRPFHAFDGLLSVCEETLYELGGKSIAQEWGMDLVTTALAQNAFPADPSPPASPA